MTWEGERDMEEDIQVYSLSEYGEVKPFVLSEIDC